MKLEFSVNKPPMHVFEYLTDAKKFVSVHPIIYKMDDLGENVFRVHEKLKLLLIPCTFKYNASITGRTEDNHVIIKATVMRLIKIEMNFYLTKNGNSTLVEENISFISVLPVKSILKQIFRQQHQQLFRNIEKA